MSFMSGDQGTNSFHVRRGLEPRRRGLAVDHRSVTAIAEGMLELYRNQSELKRQLGACLAEGKLDAFRQESIVSVYEAAVHRAIGLRGGGGA